MTAVRLLTVGLVASASFALAGCRAKVEPARAEPGNPPRPSASAAPSAPPLPVPSTVEREVPREDAPLAELRSFVLGMPSHPSTVRLGQVHDQRLLPCPGSPPSASCTPHTGLALRGVLGRGQAYLKECLVCREKKQVEALVARLRVAFLDAGTEAAWKRFDQASLLGPDQAEQVVVDTADAYPSFSAHARTRLERQRKSMGLDAAKVDGGCRVPSGFGVLVSPLAPAGGARVRILAATEEPLGKTAWELWATNEHGELKARATLESAWSGGGPPHYAGTELGNLPAGQYRVRLLAGGAPALCQRLRVGAARGVSSETSGVWQSTRGWDRNAENLYSAWIATLFDAPEPTAWSGLHMVTRNRERNLLHNHLGLAEDTPKGVAEHYLLPDCADAPYYFRAYFSWKLGLPFGRHDCRAKTLQGPLRCSDWATNDHWESTPDAGADAAPPSPPPDPVRTFGRFLNRLKNEVRAHSLRTPLGDENTDLYPVPLTRAALRPGVVYSDPYGHTLTLVRWIPQTEKRLGQLLAVDAQPDGTVSIKRFWRGNFLFVGRGKIGGFGFKAFRPIGLDAEGPRLLDNWEIGVAEGYGNYSLEQSALTASEFYARMDRLINPVPPSPLQVYRDLHDALHRQLEARVRSVELADEHFAESAGRVVEMPEGRAVFNTAGPWEAFSTPCRDLRLLVGMDVLFAYPDEATALETNPERVGSLKRELGRLHRQWASELGVTYRRSDGSLRKLSLRELLARVKQFEAAYNPNDCPEVRWGAPPDSEEMSTCQRRAPEEQQRRMDELRHWFAQRYACG